MSKKENLSENGEQKTAVTATARRASKMLLIDLVALLVCLFLAVLVWICAMNATDTDYVALKAETGSACTFSADLVEVKGPVAQLKNTTVVEVTVKDLAPGVYTLTEDMLKLPKDVHLSGDPHVTVTVGSAGE